MVTHRYVHKSKIHFYNEHFGSRDQYVFNFKSENFDLKFKIAHKFMNDYEPEPCCTGDFLARNGMLI